MPTCLSRGWKANAGNPAKLTIERQLFEMVAFLRHREILQLDGHFGNIRADDNRLYLADFGLATSPRFDLSDAERDFARRNADYASMRLVKWLVASVRGVPVSTKDDSGARNLFVQGARPVTSYRMCRRALRRSSPSTPLTLAGHALERAEPPALEHLATALCMSAQPIGQRKLKG